MSDSQSDSSETDELLSEPYYFAYSASLRIFGNIASLDELTERLGVVPTHTHRRGERTRSGAIYDHDMWSFQVPVSKHEPLHAHIDELWNIFRARKTDLLQLKSEVTVDIFLGYTSNCDHAGVEVPHTSLEMFTELRVPFGISIVVV